MGVIATALKHLIAAGISGEALLQAITDIENAMTPVIDSQAELRRERDRIRKQESRLRNSAESADTPSDGFPTPLPVTPPQKRNTPKGDISTKAPQISLDSLSVDHIADWLARKRLEGKYLWHDEHFILEYFKNYCNSKRKRYADYAAAYRNAFEWEPCQPQRAAPTGRQSTTDRALAALRDA